MRDLIVDGDVVCSCMCSVFYFCQVGGCRLFGFFFLKNPPPPEFYPLPLHAPLPIFLQAHPRRRALHYRRRSRRLLPDESPVSPPEPLALPTSRLLAGGDRRLYKARNGGRRSHRSRSEEHTSELQSPCNLVCRLLLEK